MRPQRLEIEGFSAFRAPAVVDFEGAELFALVGPTGAGKTSVIDAMTFALYGSVPRLDDRRAVAPVISQNLNEARVRLDFTVDGEGYTAVRVVRATRAGATTKEARLERGGEVLAGTADEVTEEVTRVLGLTFEHFTTCVSLPQGQFARFLHDKPRTRQDLLVRLLDLGLYDRVASAARQRGAEARSTADHLAGQVEQLAGATPEARDAAGARVFDLGRLSDHLAAERPAIDRAEATAEQATDAADAAARQVALLDDLAAPDGVEALAGELDEVATAVENCTRAEEEAGDAVAGAEENLEALPQRAELEAWRADHQRAAEIAAMVVRAEGAEAEAAAALAEARQRCDVAEGARTGRADALERLRTEHRAHALVPELAVGAPCPVCEQVVHELPSTRQPPDLTQAERALTGAEAALDRARHLVTDAERRCARAEQELSGLRAEAERLRERLATAPPAPDVDEQLRLVNDAESRLADARRAWQATRAARRTVERRHRELVEAERDGRRHFDTARDAVAALGPPPVGRDDLAGDWRDLIAWAADLRPGLAKASAEQRARADAARADAAERLRAAVEACRVAGVDVDGAAEAPGAAAAWPGELVAAALARAEEAVDRIDRQMAEAERLRTERAVATEAQQVADALAGHLAANRFEKWLLDEAIHQLVAGASQILGELTGDAYALAVDRGSGGFQVIDHTNASQARSARTLSGGETFLASLALALALADQVAGLAAAGAARLDALFLDEGFGTLDAETLDVVATALDELGARGRMVGVVTHVRELAERLPVRFEVRKVGGSATVERVAG